MKPAVHAITRERAPLLETTGNLFPLHHRDFIESSKIAFLSTEMTTDNFWGLYFRVCLNEENNRPHASGLDESTTRNKFGEKKATDFFMLYRNLITRGFSYLVRVTVCWRRTLIAGSLGGEHPSTFGFHQGSKSRLRTQTREKCAITRTASAARSCCRRQTISCPTLFI